jgi:Rieske Fe-S protein
VIFGVWPRSQQATEIAAGTVDEVEARQIVYLEEYGVFVVSSDLGPIALSDDARHVGDRVLYCAMDNTFSSPAHGERFDRLGRYMGGPAAGDLGRYLTVVTGDRVLVDLTELALPDRSASTDEPVGPGCVGAEGSPGFYEDGTP